MTGGFPGGAGGGFPARGAVPGVKNAQPSLAAGWELHRAGDVRRAEEMYRKILAVQPRNADAIALLAVLCRQTGRAPEALRLLERAQSIKPDDPRVVGELALALEAAGRLEESIPHFRRAAELAPGTQISHFHLGRVLLKTFDPETALVSLNEAHRLAPTNPDVWAHIGLAHLSRGHIARAAHHFRQVLKVQPDRAELHSHLGTCLLQENDTEGALASFRRALELKPDDASALSGVIEAYETKGDYDAAIAASEEAVRRGQAPPMVVAAYARACKRKKRPDDAVKALEAAMARPALIAQERAGLHFALGSILESTHEYDRAFGQFKQANDLYPRLYKRDGSERYVEDMKRVFPAARHARSAERSDVPVFIVGMPRSGTTLVEQIIASHPEAHGAGELNDITTITRGLKKRLGAGQPYPLCLPALTPEVTGRIAAEHIASLAARAPGKARVSDKMPHNFLHLGLIDLLFPGAKIIHCVRNPVDTCVSCYATQLSPAHSYSNNLGDLAHAYGIYRRLMEYWKGAIELPILDVVYEDVVTDQERQSRRIIDFIGLAWDDRCLRFHETKRTVGTASLDQVRSPIYDSSVGRWKRYETHLGPLIEGLKEYL